MAKITFSEALDDADDFVVSVGADDYEGLFSNGRVDRQTVPDGWHVYDLRDAFDGEVCEVKAGSIVVNHFGTFLTKKPLPLADNESLFRGGDADDFDYSFV